MNENKMLIHLLIDKLVVMYELKVKEWNFEIFIIFEERVINILKNFKDNFYRIKK